MEAAQEMSLNYLPPSHSALVNAFSLMLRNSERKEGERREQVQRAVAAASVAAAEMYSAPAAAAPSVSPSTRRSLSLRGSKESIQDDQHLDLDDAGSTTDADAEEHRSVSRADSASPSFRVRNERQGSIDDGDDGNGIAMGQLALSGNLALSAGQLSATPTRSRSCTPDARSRANSLSGNSVATGFTDETLYGGEYEREEEEAKTHADMSYM